MSAALASMLDTGAQRLGLALTQDQRDQLLAYLDLIEKWNNCYNLTSVRDKQQMLVRHLLDALSLAVHLKPKKTLDIGSGVGIPGVVLGVLWPDTDLLLVDANAKKTRFLQQVKLELGLAHVQVLHQRIQCLPEQAHLIQGLEQVVSRALGSLADMLGWCSGFLSEKIDFYAMKGNLTQVELEAIQKAYKILETIKVQVPFMEAESRHILRIRPLSSVNVCVDLSGK